jgi:hypothetical protein
MSNLRGMLQGVVILASAVVLFYLAYTYYTKKIEKESFQDYAPVSDEESANSAEPAKEPAPMMTTTVASPQQLNPSEKKNKPKGCFPKDKLTPEDLLPKDAANSEWAKVNPASQGDVDNQNYLTAGYHMGINSIGSTLRNPNLQLRSEPPNPQVKVSPWLQTTIDPDLNRRPLEINGC